MTKWQRAKAAIASAASTAVHLKIPFLALLPILVFIAIAQLVFGRYSFHPWAGDGLFAYTCNLFKVAFPASLSAAGTGFGKMSYAIVTIVILAAIMWIRHPDDFKQHLLRNVWYAVIAAVLGWIPFGLIGLLRTAYDQQQASAGAGSQINATLAETRQKLKTAEETIHRKTYTPDFRDPAFFTLVEGVRAFMAYRRAIGPDASCKILITEAPPDDGGLNIGPLTMALISIAVLGSNCPNGDLQNIGIKPENAEAESQKGLQPGVIVLHALGDAKGANQLVNNLGNLIQVRRSYKMPVEIAADQNVIWLQLGPGLKWNAEQ